MIELNRIGNEVYYKDKKLTIVAQATKGPNKEAVKIEGLEGSNGQKWVSLSKLKEGLNIIETQAREITTTSKKYELTKEEQARINELQAEIDNIINNAKQRYVAKPNLNIDASKLSATEKAEYIANLKKYYANLGIEL